MLSGLPVVGGCAEESSGLTNQTDQTNAANPPAAAPTLAAQAATNTVPAQTNAASEVATSSPAPPDLAAENKPPPNVMISSSLSEVVRMAQAGIEEGVMLSFVTNSAGTFNLGSDQIIYLNDLGVSSAVVTAMIQRDQVWNSGAGFSSASTVPSPLPPAPMPASAAQPGAAAAAAPSDAPPEATVAATQYAPSSSSAPPPPQEAPPAPDQAPPPTVVNNNYFSDALSPYGNWVNVNGYGWCWQPTVTVVNSDWRPYCDGGRWLYTDNGWYWASDYTWGGIAFHYGRWFSDPRWGWCWWPDTCWGPSWVTWRYGGGYCGWAPLPPCSYWTPGVGFSYYGNAVGLSFGFGLGYGGYSFVPWNHFYDARPYRYALAGGRAAQIYNNTTVVNNYINGNNNTIINDGLGVTKVSQFSRSEIRKVAVRDAPLAPGTGPRSDRIARENGKLVVYRPIAPVTSTSDVNRGTRAVPPAAGANRNVATRQELAPASRPATLRGAPGLAHNSPSAQPGAAARKEMTFPVRASVPVPLTDPIIRPQPIQRTPNLLQVDLASRPVSPANNARPDLLPAARTGPTTTWPNNARDSIYRRQLAMDNNAAPAQMAPTFDRPAAPAGSTPGFDRGAPRDFPVQSRPVFERPYRPPAAVESAPAQPRYYAPFPARVESYSAPPAVSAPAPRPAPSYSAPSGGRSGRNQFN